MHARPRALGLRSALLFSRAMLRMHVQLSLVSWLISCAGSLHPSHAIPTPAAAQSLPKVSDVEALFNALPGEAHHCVFARNAAITESVRAALVELLPVERYLWDARLKVQEFALVAKAHGGAQARSAVIRTVVSRTVVEEVLGSLARYTVRFSGEPVACVPESCPLVVSFVEPDLVRMDLGRFVEHGLRSETVHDCVRLAQESPLPVFVMSERAQPTLGSALGPLQVRVSVRILQDQVSITARDVYVDEEAANDALKVGVMHSILRSPVADLTGTLSRSVQGRQMITKQVLTQQDLEQLASDVEVKKRARHYGELLAKLPPFDAGAAHSEADWLAAIDLRLELLASSGRLSAAHPIAKNVVELIAAARAAYPQSDEWSKRQERLQHLLDEADGGHP